MNRSFSASELSKGKIIAVGDGANDLLMLQRAGFGIAYNGKPKLQENVSSLTQSY